MTVSALLLRVTFSTVLLNFFLVAHGSTSDSPSSPPPETARHDEFYDRFRRCQEYFALCNRSASTFSHCYVCGNECRLAASLARPLLRITLESFAVQCEVQLQSKQTFPEADPANRQVRVDSCTAVWLPTVRRLSL